MPRSSDLKFPFPLSPNSPFLIGIVFPCSRRDTRSLVTWTRSNTTLILISLFLSLGFAWYVSSRPMDFRVYYHGADGVFSDTRPVYGDKSGMGWPMHYRYPPLFLFLAYPFTLLPLPWAAALWTFLRCVMLIALMVALWNRLGPTTSKAAWLIPLLFAGPYVVEDLRYGNAQTFIFALTGLALLAVSAAPLLAAAALALAISIKVWPFFFVPLLVAKREWKVVGLDAGADRSVASSAGTALWFQRKPRSARAMGATGILHANRPGGNLVPQPVAARRLDALPDRH